MANDFEFLGGAGGLAQGFMQAIKDKQDREERLKESSEDRALRKLQLKMSAAEHGFDINADYSGYTPNPEFAHKQQIDQRLKAFGEGALPVTDESGNITGFQADPNSYKGRELGFKDEDLAIKKQAGPLGLIKEGLVPAYDANGNLDLTKVPKINKDFMDAKAKAKLAGSPYASTLDQRQAFSAHQKNIQALKKDPVLIKRLNQYQNLDNALSMITQAHEITPQQIHEFQQAVRGNMGITGTSGVGEREETYFKTAGLNAANWKQFLTGDPVSISKDSKLMDHLRDLANVEQNNIKKQYDTRIKAVTGGNSSIYKNFPDMKDDLDELVQSYGGQIGSPGMIQEPPKGMMKMRKVQDSSGAVFQIPEEDLADALADGAVEVE